jgi:uncharacterized protein (UPF0276 family)
VAAADAGVADAAAGAGEDAEVAVAADMDSGKAPELGLGIGWRAPLAVMIERRRDLRFVEVTAEHFAERRVPAAVDVLREQGRVIVPHGISVSLGSAEGMNVEGVKLLESLARRFGSPFVSEHLAWVRAGELEAGHLLPLPRTKAALAVVVENVKRAQGMLSVPLALENVSALFAWPEAEMTEADFLREVLERTGALLLLDTSNVYANAVNVGTRVGDFLDGIPLERLAYVHVGGGEEREGVYHDTHSHAVTAEALGVLAELVKRRRPPGVMLERDDGFPGEAELEGELEKIRAVMEGR